MKSTIKLLACLCLLGVTACDKEDDLVADVRDTSFYFEPLPDAMDEESVMRREFFEKTGSHLLFNDTLQHRFIGVDYRGDSCYFTERLDLTYSIGSPNIANTKYSYNLLADMEKKTAAVEFLEKYVLAHIGGDLKPFSWFLVGKITSSYLNKITYPNAAYGERAIVVACDILSRLRTEAQRQQYALQVINSIMGHLMDNNKSKIQAFYEGFESYYGGTFAFSGTDEENMQYLYSVGFITRGKNEYGVFFNGYYPQSDADLGDYTRLLLNNTDEQIEARFKDYPIVIRRAKLLKGILIDLGYVF